MKNATITTGKLKDTFTVVTSDGLKHISPFSYRSKMVDLLRRSRCVMSFEWAWTTVYYHFKTRRFYIVDLTEFGDLAITRRLKYNGSI